MKIAILLLSIIGLVVCEYCSDSDSTTTCHMDCAAPQVPMCESNMCTCGDMPNTACVVGNDAHCTDYWKHHHCEHEKRHCIDGRCTCFDDDK